jgi:CDP-diglyceride synthetase
LAVLLSGKKFFVRRVVSASVGFLVGLIPLAVVNLLTGGISFRAYREFSAKAVSDDFHLAEISSFLGGFLSLGDGQGVRHFVLGVQPVPWIHVLENSFLILLLGVAGVLAARSWRKDNHARLAGIGLMAYLSILLLFLCVLRKGSGGHHWLAGTPFQYVSMAMAASLIGRRFFIDSSPSPKPSFIHGSFLARSAVGLFIIFALIRVYSVAALEKDLAARLASPAWDPSYTAVAAYAAKHEKDAGFVAADWGFAPQIYCLSNGAFPVAEPIWSWGYRWGPDLLLRYLAQKPGRPVYVLLRKLEAPVRPAATEDIVRVVSYLAGGKLLPLEEELKNYRSVQVLKFAPPGG